MKPKSGKRGRPKGSGNKRRLDDEPETTVKRPRPRKPRGMIILKSGEPCSTFLELLYNNFFRKSKYRLSGTG